MAIGGGVVPVATPLIFASQFRSGTGSTDANRRDTSSSTPWDSRAGEWGEIVSAAGTGIPSTNCLRITCEDLGSGNFFRLVYNGFPELAINDSLYLRWYFNAQWNDGLTDNGNHPIEDTGVSTWTFNTRHNTGSWRMHWNPVAETDVPNWRFYLKVDLTKEVAYRFELQIKRVGTATMEMHSRVYNAAGTLLYTDADFLNEDNSVSLADNPVLALGSLSALQGWQIGIEGLGGSDWHPSMLYAYQGCFAASTTDWCGPYIEGEQA